MNKLKALGQRIVDVAVNESVYVQGKNVNVGAKLAEGGFAVVYEARDDRNRFALKKMYFREKGIIKKKLFLLICNSFFFYNFLKKNN